MAPTQVVVAAAAAVVDPVGQDVVLAHRAAALLTILQPRKTPETIVKELLDRLKTEKLVRDYCGLNHWQEHAPQLLAGLVRQARIERRRRREEAEACFRAKHREAVHFVRAIVGDAPAAEALASDTYLELLDGRATAPGFFPALVGNARNYLEAESFRREKQTSLDDAPASSQSAEDHEIEGETSFDPPSHRLSDQDPLDVLIARETDRERELREPIERKDELEHALSVVRCPGNRHVLKKKWWKESALGALEKERHEVLVASLRTERRRFRVKFRGPIGQVAG